jgi:hypothetical protein
MIIYGLKQDVNDRLVFSEFDIYCSNRFVFVEISMIQQSSDIQEALSPCTDACEINGERSEKNSSLKKGSRQWKERFQ